jgi:hypothetical protein
MKTDAGKSSGRFWRTSGNDSQLPADKPIIQLKVVSGGNGIKLTEISADGFIHLYA